MISREPEVSFILVKGTASFLISSRPSIGIFFKSSSGEGVPWYSFRRCVSSTSAVISSLVRDALYPASFSCSFCSVTRFLPRSGITVTTAPCVLSSRYSCTSFSKYPVFICSRRNCRVSRHSRWINGFLSSNSQLSRHCSPYKSPFG